MPVDKRPTGYAKHMRKNPTGPENALWDRLRQKQLFGLRFRRQQPIGPYIVDFYCSELRLVIELDGAGHEQQAAYDLKRKSWLESEGYRVNRIGSDHRFSDPDEVFPFIVETCQQLMAETLPPAPSPTSAQTSDSGGGDTDP